MFSFAVRYRISGSPNGFSTNLGLHVQCQGSGSKQYATHLLDFLEEPSARRMLVNPNITRKTSGRV